MNLMLEGMNYFSKAISLTLPVKIEVIDQSKPQKITVKIK